MHAAMGSFWSRLLAAKGHAIEDSHSLESLVRGWPAQVVLEGAPTAWLGELPARAWPPPLENELWQGLPDWKDTFAPAAGRSAGGGSSGDGAAQQPERPRLHLVRPLFGAGDDHAELLADLDAAHHSACAAKLGK